MIRCQNQSTKKGKKSAENQQNILGCSGDLLWAGPESNSHPFLQLSSPFRSPAGIPGPFTHLRGLRHSGGTFLVRTCCCQEFALKDIQNVNEADQVGEDGPQRAEMCEDIPRTASRGPLWQIPQVQGICRRHVNMAEPE